MELRISVFDAISPALSESSRALAYNSANPSPIAIPPTIATALFGLNDLVGMTDSRRTVC